MIGVGGRDRVVRGVGRLSVARRRAYRGFGGRRAYGPQRSRLGPFACPRRKARYVSTRLVQLCAATPVDALQHEWIDVTAVQKTFVDDEVDMPGKLT